MSSATARAKLPRRGKGNKPHWTTITGAPDLALGYQLPERAGEPGRWHVRKTMGNGAYSIRLIGPADDLANGNGLTMDEAAERARAIFAGAVEGKLSELTVATACALYVAAHEGGYGTEYQRTIELHVEPYLAHRTVRELTRSDLTLYRTGLVARLMKAKRAKIAAGSWAEESGEEIERKARDSANRIMTIVKAALNHAFADPEHKLPSDDAWKHGLKLFERKKVSRPREFHFSPEEVKGLICMTIGPERPFAELMTGAWLTGCRYGELCQLRVKHFDARLGVLEVEGRVRGAWKTGPRMVQLSPPAVRYFRTLTDGRRRDAPIFEHHSGREWRDTDQQKPMKRALKRAGLPSKATFYALRHSHISRAIEENVPIHILAKNCGTSVLMIEQTYAKILATRAAVHFERLGAVLDVEAPALPAVVEHELEPA